MKSSLCHRVQSSFIINAKIQIMIPHKTLNHSGGRSARGLFPRKRRDLLIITWRRNKFSYQIILCCSFFVWVRAKRSQMQDMNPDWKRGLWGEKKTKKSRQMLIRDSQKFPCVWKKPSRTKWISHLTVYSCAWTPEKVNYGEECREIWRAPSNVKVTRHPAG